MNRRWLLILTFGLMPTVAWAADKLPAKPNVLFIAIDDLRDWVGFLGDKQVKTPNLDRLASRGVVFRHAYCASPSCNPSRTALMSGLRPTSSSVYDNAIDWRPTPAAKVTHLNQAFMAAGYDVRGCGKIYHENYQAPEGYWHEYRHGGTRTPKLSKTISPLKPFPSAWGYGNFQIGPLDNKDEDMVDYQIVDYALEFLAKPHDKPFFLACGLKKPHLPFQVPKKYFDMYPVESIQLPEVRTNELDGVPPAGVKMANPSGDHKTITEAGKWKETVQAYLATITFCDTMVGRLLDGFDRSPHKDNTLIVLWSDHGWHLGEKFHWRKFALWEQATRAPLLFVVPGLTKPGSVCTRPVDFMSIYPTLCELCGIAIPAHVQGKSIKTLLADPNAPWDLPAIMNHGFQNHAIRSERFRYIRYANGDEELYDHQADPREWNNLANDPKFEAVKKELAAFIPQENVRPGQRRKDKE